MSVKVFSIYYIDYLVINMVINMVIIVSSFQVIYPFPQDITNLNVFSKCVLRVLEMLF